MSAQHAAFAAGKYVSVWSGYEVVTNCLISLATGDLTIQACTVEEAREVDGLVYEQEFVRVGDQQFKPSRTPRCGYQLKEDQITVILAMGPSHLCAFPIQAVYTAIWDNSLEVSVPCSVDAEGLIEGAERIWRSDDVLAMVASLELDHALVQLGGAKFEACQGNDGQHRLEGSHFQDLALMSISQPAG